MIRPRAKQAVAKDNKKPQVRSTPVAKRYRGPNTLAIGQQARTGVAGNEGRSMDCHRCATSFHQIGDSIAIEGACVKATFAKAVVNP